MDKAVGIEEAGAVSKIGDTGNAEILPGKSRQRVVGQQVGGADDGFGVLIAGDAVAVGLDRTLVVDAGDQQAGLTLTSLDDDAFGNDMGTGAFGVGNQVGKKGARLKLFPYNPNFPCATSEASSMLEITRGLPCGLASRHCPVNISIRA